MPTAYSSPGSDLRYCDLILKGGLTSGVVYPSAVCQLAKHFQFRNIGGTSAGAIIAAATAAAELGGRGRPNAGFERLKQFTSWFGTGTHHFDLFQPQDSTRGLFEVAFALVGHEHGARRGLRLVGKSFRHFPLWVVVGLIPGVVVASLASAPTNTFALIAWLVFLVLWTIATIVVVIAGVFVFRASRLIPANGFGLSRGYDPKERPERPGITSWLDRELNLLAGRSGTAAPLTFGDLWGPDEETELAPPRDSRRINLEMMTTCLTLGRPYRLPFTVDREFYFNPGEFYQYFPERIVQHCIDHAGGKPKKSADGLQIYPLPRPRHLPVVVAVRMSLSFPILFSALPLYTVDGGRPKKERRPPERCWFSDGGISSNLPLHFFDNLVPRWPTFAINLRPFTAAYPRSANEAENVWMPECVEDGRSEWWTRLEVDPETERPSPKRRQLGNFFGAILDTALNWRDNIQVQTPGYRERVVHVKVDDRTEGGLNLRMDPKVLRKLSQRGAAAGDLIRQRYIDPPTSRKAVSWPSHRWTRYRTAMQVQQRMLERMVEAYEYQDSYTPVLSTLIDRPTGDPPNVYEWTEPQRCANPRQATEALLAVEESWERQRLAFGDGAPTPYPELRVVPRL